MPLRTDIFDLGRLALTSGEGRRLDLHVRLERFHFAGSAYDVVPAEVPVRLDVSRTTSGGHALRLRFTASVSGPCMRCLELAEPHFEVDAREVHQPSAGEELTSPYVEGDELELAKWARDAYALTLPGAILCRPDCAGLCPQCGANLNDEPDHRHEAPKDSRWSALDALKFE